MPSAAERFWAKVDKRADDECWPWQASLRGRYYGSFWNGHRNVRAHRFAYELLVGAVPLGLTLDHLCRNPLCVNPAHLEPVTNHENNRRGNGWAGLNARKTRCPQGHAYDEENTYVSSQGRRHCRTCNNERTRERRLVAQLMREGGPAAEEGERT